MARWIDHFRAWMDGAPYSLGKQGEDLAVHFLKGKRYVIVGRNVRIGRYEVDIIARDGDTTVFVEVKTRIDDAFATPDQNVHAQKRRKLIAAARRYAAMENAPEMYYRFDVVSVLIPREGKPSLSIHRDAFNVR